MYQAIGRSVTQQNDGIVVLLDIVDDKGVLVLTAKFVGKDLDDVKGQIAAQLKSLQGAVVDATLSQAVVGQVLGSL